MNIAGRRVSILLRRIHITNRNCEIPKEWSKHGNINDGRFHFHGSKVWTRRISVCTPLYMGRRACKIAARKGAQDLKRSKFRGKIIKYIVSAVRREGSNPETNLDLANLLLKAKDHQIPKEILERNIKKATEKGQAAFTEKVYEIYGYGGVGIIVEVLTDNVLRSSMMVKDVVKKSGAKMADPGSVQFKFKRVRVVHVKSKNAVKDKLFDAALDAGADDIIEPAEEDNEMNDEESERHFKVITTTENYKNVTSKFESDGIPFETDNGYEFVPETPVEADDEAVDLNKELISKLLDIDDVDAVYCDQK